MAPESTWTVEQGTWHVAQGTDGRWKVHREGEATVESRHDSQEAAIQAAQALAMALPDARIKIHHPDGTLDQVLEPQPA